MTSCVVKHLSPEATLFRAYAHPTTQMSDKIQVYLFVFSVISVWQSAWNTSFFTWHDYSFVLKGEHFFCNQISLEAKERAISINLEVIWNSFNGIVTQIGSTMKCLLLSKNCSISNVYLKEISYQVVNACQQWS